MKQSNDILCVRVDQLTYLETKSVLETMCFI